jgi:hypothetical protein
MSYLVALVASGLSRDEGHQRVPSCALFARVVQGFEREGRLLVRMYRVWKPVPTKDAYRPLSGSLRTRLLRRRIDRLARLQGCGEVLGARMKRACGRQAANVRLARRVCRPGLRAVPGLSGRRPNSEQPSRHSYKGQQSLESSRPGQPQWAQCLNYDPANLPAHLRQCLGTGPDRRRLRGVPPRTGCLYGAASTQAYGGLPENFLVLPCSVADGYLADIPDARGSAEKQPRSNARKKHERAQARCARQTGLKTLRDNPPSRPSTPSRG